MEQITISLFNFNELPKNIQSAVLDNQRYSNVDDESWSEEIIEDWKGKLADWGFCNPDIFFSGFGCQGDGACFTCDDIDFVKYTSRLIMQTDSYDQAKWLQVFALLFDKGILSAEIRHEGHYVHENSTRLRYELLLQSEDVSKRFNDILLANIETCMASISKAIYRELEAYHDLLTDDDEIAHSLVRDEIRFLKDGRIWD